MLSPAYSHMQGKKIVVLDRDGVINQKPGPRQYLRSPSEIRYLPGVRDSLARLAERGYAFVVCTVQMGIGLSLVREEEVRSVNEAIEGDLRSRGITILGWYVCPHREEEGCVCRKPKPGLLLAAAREHDFDPAEAWNIGDSPRDILMGRNAGCTRNILLQNGYAARQEELAAVRPVPLVQTLGQAVDLLLQNQGESIP